MINDILDLSKVEAGKLDISRDEFSFQNMIKTIVEMIRLRVKQKNIEFAYEERSELPVAVWENMYFDFIIEMHTGIFISNQ